MCNWLKIINKPFALSCERNQEVIRDVLASIIKDDDKILLEIGSGTGQHASFIAPCFPNLQWHTSDLEENHQGIKQWIDESKATNILTPVVFESEKIEFPKLDIDVVFTANTLHIMSWENVKKLIHQLGEHLKKGAKIIIYGPFNYGGKYTSQSNEKFDEWLKLQNKSSAIRDFEKIQYHMNKNGFVLKDDYEMPSNNRILFFVK